MSLIAQRPWLVASVTLVVLVATTYAHNLLAVFPAYRQLHRTAPFYYVESIDQILVVALCVLAVWLMRRAPLREAIHELGLSAPILPAFAFALGVSLPMLIGFGLTRSLTPHLQLLPTLYLTVFSPFVEELESRGFGVRQLQRGTSWPFWVVVWPSAVLFGWSHVERGENLLSADVRARHRLGVASTVQVALAALQRLDLIAREDDGHYTVVDSLMREWIARETH